jgi:hypothetical protein
MSEFQWWLLIVGLVIGGTVVGLLTANFSRDETDLDPDERDAEATFIAGHLRAAGHLIDAADAARVLEAHREYLGLPAPVAIVPADRAAAWEPPGSPDRTGGGASAGDRDADDETDDVRDRGGRAADRDLAEP